MATDDAADLIVEIEQERRGRILALLPPAQRRQIEALLGYNPSTAGGLMSPDFIGLPENETAAAAIERVRSSEIRAGNAHHCLPERRRGQAVRARWPWSRCCAPPRKRRCRASLSTSPCPCTPTPILPEVARTMTDYNLVMLAVVGRAGARGGRGHSRRRARADAAQRLAAEIGLVRD